MQACLRVSVSASYDATGETQERVRVLVSSPRRPAPAEKGAERDTVSQFANRRAPVGLGGVDLTGQVA